MTAQLPRLAPGRRTKLITPARLIAALDATSKPVRQARPWPPLHRFQLPPTEVATPAMTDHVITLHLSGDAETETDVTGRMRGYRLRPGQVGLIPAMQPTSWRLAGGAGFLHLYLPTDTLAGYAQEAGLADRLRPGFGLDDPFLASLLRRIADVASHAEPVDKLLCESIERTIALHLLATYGERAVALGSTAMSAQRLRAVRSLVEDNLADALTLELLAGAAGMSRFHFARAFRAATGMTPYRYVTQRRIARARALLVAGELPVADIALAVGFTTASHFARAFRQATGESPTAYRRHRRR
ncbi:AraC family transcriptional regulator [Elioraea rosea]|uniref:AraC family transcriptional regulator n=1 Tax=Elioraea rosea TaxID=2492390 RepID=UPI0013152E67|nr:AraC family transcriptional regulator [Elioraea rosea]